MLSFLSKHYIVEFLYYIIQAFGNWTGCEYILWYFSQTFPAWYGVLVENIGHFCLCYDKTTNKSRFRLSRRKISLSRNPVPEFILCSCSNPMQQASISNILEQQSAMDLSLTVESTWLQGTKAFSPHPVGSMASWLVLSSPDRVVLVRALVEGVALCSWTRHFILNPSLSGKNKIFLQTFRRLCRWGWEPP